MGELEPNVARFFTGEFIERLNNFEFSFPMVVACMVIHTAFVSPDGRLWIHLWLFKNAPPAEGEQPLGQLSLVYPVRATDQSRNDMKIACVVNESFW
ncbi:MAG: hypothetical protein QW838_07205 [Candidatus Nitrosotenuis sp.]